MNIEHSVVVGDSIWDLLVSRRARALGVGLLSGGYGQDELQAAGAYRVYDDPADLLLHLDEVGVRGAFCGVLPKASSWDGIATSRTTLAIQRRSDRGVQ